MSTSREILGNDRRIDGHWLDSFESPLWNLSATLRTLCRRSEPTRCWACRYPQLHLPAVTTSISQRNILGNNVIYHTQGNGERGPKPSPTVPDAICKPSLSMPASLHLVRTHTGCCTSPSIKSKVKTFEDAQEDAQSGGYMEANSPRRKRFSCSSLARLFLLGSVGTVLGFGLHVIVVDSKCLVHLGTESRIVVNPEFC